MNYQKLYDSIIGRAKGRIIPSGTYVESHHITPRSLGGCDDSDNLVNVTGREHFILHLLLVKIHRGSSGHRKMLHAFMLMKGGTESQERYINSRLYDTQRVEFAALQRERFTGVPKSTSHRANISKALTGKVTSDETKRKQSESASKRPRKPFSEDYKQKMSEKMKLVRANKASVAEMD